MKKANFHYAGGSCVEARHRRQNVMTIDASSHAPASVNGPLHIDFIPYPGGGRIGLVHCPGRTGRDSRGRDWARDLKADLAAIRASGASTLITLLEAQEFAVYGVETLPERVADAGLGWFHWPIRDMAVPSEEAQARIASEGRALSARLHAGETIVIHCAAGLGRSGMVAAQWLVRAGLSPDAAIAQVRAARPGTIETEAQEDAIRAVSRA